MIKLKKISLLLTILILLQAGVSAAQTYNADGTTSGTGAGASGGINEESEPSDDYRPDGYYEPYDFSFVKTNQNKGSNSSSTPTPVVENNTSGPTYDSSNQITNNSGNQSNSGNNGSTAVTTAPEYQPPAYPPNEQINVPEPPDFNETAVSAPVQNGNSKITTAISPDSLNNIPAAGQQPAGSGHTVNSSVSASSNASGNTSNMPPSGETPAQSSAPAASTLKLLIRAQKPLRYQLTNDKLSGILDKVIVNENVEDESWNLIAGSIKNYFNEASSNKLNAAVIDDEFEKINAVLITYIYGGTFGAYDGVILKYKNQHFGFLGPLAKEVKNFSIKGENSEERYRLLRLLGGDIVKVISDKLFMFSLKPLSFCVSEIMREVANGEFYKIEVLFRVMSSADLPVQNLIRPFFQLLKSKLFSAYEVEKNQNFKKNYAKAYDILNKIR